jgi:ribonuclease P protein component
MRPRRETDVPTEQTCAQAPPWLSRAHGDGRRAQGSVAPPGQGPQAAERLSAALHGLKNRAEFLFVRQGVRANRALVGVEARRREANGPIRFGLTASKKVGNAPTRNRARRRLREAARQLLPQFGVAGVDYVLIARTATAEAGWARLLDDLQTALISVRGSLEGCPARGKRDEAG